MDWFDEEELPYHVHIYRRFIKSVRYILLVQMVAATFVSFTYFINGGNWVAGLFLAAIVLAIGLFFIRGTPIHPHAAIVRRLPHGSRHYDTTRR